MITEFHAENYGPLKNVTCALTPLHAFIGPNDSGKSTLLRAIKHALDLAVGGMHASNFRLTFDSGLFINADGSSSPSVETKKWLRGGAFVCRFDADSLRAASGLILERDALTFVANRGVGLPGVLDILNNRVDNALVTISEEISRLFPTLARLQLRNVSNTEKQLGALLKDGVFVDAAQMSEGMLYYVAYAALRALAAGALIAVEEPETGLHPARIADVMKVLRSIAASGTQVIVATHSPLVVNELEPGEVSLVTRTLSEGTKVTKLANTADFARRSKTFSLGELWLNYANGNDEKPLLEGGPRDVKTA